ncbi:MAG: hypothetical protein KAR40_15455 [Candidatus Sabulitectum sp.]|nr:hypothetical protein [Candidatus Sabulitectum sp.]
MTTLNEFIKRATEAAHESAAAYQAYRKEERRQEVNEAARGVLIAATRDALNGCRPYRETYNFFKSADDNRVNHGGDVRNYACGRVYDIWKNKIPTKTGLSADKLQALKAAYEALNAFEVHRVPADIEQRWNRARREVKYLGRMPATMVGKPEFNALQAITTRYGNYKVTASAAKHRVVDTNPHPSLASHTAEYHHGAMVKLCKKLNWDYTRFHPGNLKRGVIVWVTV